MWIICLQLIHNNKAINLFSTPAILESILSAKNNNLISSSIEHIIFGGEALTKDVYNPSSQQTLEIDNWYGPTECAVMVTTANLASVHFNNIATYRPTHQQHPTLSIKQQPQPQRHRHPRRTLHRRRRPCPRLSQPPRLNRRALHRQSL